MFTSIEPKDFWLYYAVVIVFAILLFLRKRPRRGMRLKLREGQSAIDDKVRALKVEMKPEPIQERVLNVHFNYNGHSWDAFEVLGIPAGSAADKVDVAFKESLIRVDAGSRPFIEAAYSAIHQQTKSKKAQ
ncbi:MAG TPA: hypothetical protein PKC28_12085 [Bdellovibrionales bacterium]|nr:hypothetical protein [Bdellovibrionales bacterium]